MTTNAQHTQYGLDVLMALTVSMKHVYAGTAFEGQSEREPARRKALRKVQKQSRRQNRG